MSIHESRKDKVLSTVDLIMSVLIGKLRANEQNPTIITDHQESVVVVQVFVLSPIIEKGKEPTLNDGSLFFI